MARTFDTISDRNSGLATSVAGCSLCFSLISFTILLGLAGCAGQPQKDRGFFTSGNREADQRAEQRVEKDQQLRSQSDNGAAQSSEKSNKNKSLYDRLGGEQGLTRIVNDFMTRALNDPRVNWERKGITRGGVLGLGAKSAYWDPSPQNVQQLEKHIVQFLSVASGGPAHYDGKEMHQAHKGLQISNPEFDAAVGDLKASLDKLGVGTDEQKELLAIIESTRTQVVEKR